MPQYSWSTCPEDVRAQLQTLVRELQSVLGEALVGVYLHGSLAAGCFNSACSDLDILVVHKRPTPIPEKHLLAELLFNLSGRPIPIEISFLSTSDIIPWRYPTPYDFHFSEDHRDRIRECLDTGQSNLLDSHQGLDEDLAAHITMLRQTGISLAGLPIRQVFPPIPAADYRSSILSDFKWAGEHLDESPLYAVLNACRVLAYVKEGKICSKQQAGEWATQELPAERATIIRAALEAYSRNGRLPGVSREMLRAFIVAIGNEIAEAG